MSLLILNNLTLRLSKDRPSILQQINYQVNPGDFVILLGNNGSGKSSLLKIIHQHYQPSSGNISLQGKPLSSYSKKFFAKQIAVLTQNSAESLFENLSIYENYLIMQPDKTKRKAHYLQTYLQNFNINLTKNIHQSVSKLSGGEKQALGLAFCLLASPEILLLDEHTSALDPNASAQIMQLTAKLIAEKNMTCILTTHDLDIALKYGNRILILREGKVYKTYENKAMDKQDLIANYC